VLFSLGVAASNRYNAILVDHLRRELGVQFEERPHGRDKQMVKEVAGISDTMIAEFSRRADIVGRTEELTTEYRTQYGRTPSKATQIRLAQQAVLDTRDAKPVPRSLAAMRTDWAERAAGYTRNRSPEAFVDHLLATHRDPSVLRDFDPEEVALAAGVAFHRRREQTLEPVIERELDRCIFATPTDREQGRRQVQSLLGDRSEGGFGERIAEAIAAQARTVYDRDRIATEVLDTVSRRRATWTDANLRTVAEDAVSRCTFPTAADQRQAVEAVVDQARDRGSLLLSVDPDQPPKALSRRDGQSVYTVHGAKRYTSEAVLAAEERLLTAGHTPTTEFVTTAALDTAIRAAEKASERELNDGQKQIATHLATSGQLLSVAIGPAGAGKTTAMQAVCRAWSDDGRQVLALAPSAAAAGVLGDELGVPGRTVASVLTAAQHGVNTGITPGAMLLVDEAGMTATADLDQLLTLAREHGAVVRLIGDPYQLGAVESGGALKLLANDTAAPELSEVVRFTDPAEAAASLSVRDGDASNAWEFYQGNHRISAGMVDELREKILTNHLADTESGKSSLMLAATVADVTALNNAAQTAHAHNGIVDTTSTRTVLADGLSAHAGDVIVTRRNNPRLKVAGGRRDGSGVSNGHLWKVTSVHEDGSLTVTGRDHRGRVHLPNDYVDEHVELGYAATIHRAQGMTVDRCHTLMNATLGRSLAYVGLTRGRQDNQVYLATDQAPDPDLDHAPEQVVTDQEVFSSILARGDDNVTATETLRTELDRIDDPNRLRAMYADVTGELSEQRAKHLLDRALPATLYATAEASEHFGDLLRTVAVADQHGMNTQAMVSEISSRGDEALAGENLLHARDIAAVLRARADHWIDTHREQPGAPSATTAPATGDTPGAPGEDQPRFRALRDLPARDEQLAALPPRHPGMDTELADYARTLAERITLLEAAAQTTVSAAADPETAPARDTAASQEPHLEQTRPRGPELVQQMRADLIRLRTDHDLDTTIARLRGRLAHAGSDITDWAPPQTQSTAATVAADHAQLARQLAAIRTAETAVDAERDAATAVRDVNHRVGELTRELTGLPGRRIGRRRDLTAQLDTLRREQHEARGTHQHTQVEAIAAANTAADLGAHPSTWPQVIARATNPGRLAAELNQAQATDTHRAQAAAEQAQRVAGEARKLRAQLSTAELERARRGGLPPEQTASEHQVRTQHSDAHTAVLTPPQPEHPGVDATERRHDTGPER